MITSAMASATASNSSACNPPPDRAVRLKGGAGCVVVDLLGGRIASWKTSDGKEMFFMPERYITPNGDWSHGGIGVCWPWFGKKGADPSSIHGFAKNRLFALRRRETLENGETATLGLTTREGEIAEFPYDADLELKVTVTDKLALKLSTVNKGKVSFELSNGFQPYFAVGSYSSSTLSGVKDAPFKAVDGMDAAFPRIGDAFSLADTSLGRTISCIAKGNTGLVVWSPGNVEPHNRNLAAGDTERFIGVGPSNRTKEGAIVLAPGASHELVFEMQPTPTPTLQLQLPLSNSNSLLFRNSEGSQRGSTNVPPDAPRR